MIRLLIKEMAGDPDGKTHISWKTFDVELLEVEAFLKITPGYYDNGSRQIIGAELLGDKLEKEKEGK